MRRKRPEHVSPNRTRLGEFWPGEWVMVEGKLARVSAYISGDIFIRWQEFNLDFWESELVRFSPDTSAESAPEPPWYKEVYGDVVRSLDRVPSRGRPDRDSSVQCFFDFQERRR